MSMDIPVPRRQRDENPQFHLEAPTQHCLWPITEERHLGIFFLAPILYSGLCGHLSPDKTLPKYSDGRETTKNTVKCLSPIIKALLPGLWDWLDAWCPCLTTEVCCKAVSKLYQSCRRLSEGIAKLVLFPVIHKEKT